MGKDQLNIMNTPESQVQIIVKNWKERGTLGLDLDPLKFTMAESVRLACEGDPLLKTEGGKRSRRQKEKKRDSSKLNSKGYNKERHEPLERRKRNLNCKLNNQPLVLAEGETGIEEVGGTEETGLLEMESLPLRYPKASSKNKRHQLLPVKIHL